MTDTTAQNQLDQATTLAKMAKDEDLGDGDVTSGLIDPATRGTFALAARQRGVFAGREIVPAVLAAYGESIQTEWTDRGRDGETIGQDASAILTLSGPVRDVLTIERVLLNFLQRLCGIATLTRAYVDAVAGTDAKIFDTRKTTPGWRHLEKYAVRCGGGFNHRMGLYDAVLIKDNHLAGIPADRLAGIVFGLLNQLTAETGEAARSTIKFVEVEADTLEQVEALLSVVGIDVILLDNFSPDRLREAVTLRDGMNLRGRVALEASGGITLATARSVAETGIDRISVGAITHSAPSLDLGLDAL